MALPKHIYGYNVYVYSIKKTLSRISPPPHNSNSSERNEGDFFHIPLYLYGNR